MGTDGRRYVEIDGIQWQEKRYNIWELMAAVSIYKDGKSYQAIRQTEKGTNGRRNVIQSWELMAGDTIIEMGTDGRRYDVQRCELRAGDTMCCDVIS